MTSYSELTTTWVTRWDFRSHFLSNDFIVVDILEEEPPDESLLLLLDNDVPILLDEVNFSLPSLLSGSC